MKKEEVNFQKAEEVKASALEEAKRVFGEGTTEMGDGAEDSIAFPEMNLGDPYVKVTYAEVYISMVFRVPIDEE